MFHPWILVVEKMLLERASSPSCGSALHSGDHTHYTTCERRLDLFAILASRLDCNYGIDQVALLSNISSVVNDIIR
jgi:hypothetical protein